MIVGNKKVTNINKTTVIYLMMHYDRLTGRRLTTSFHLLCVALIEVRFSGGRCGKWRY